MKNKVRLLLGLSLIGFMIAPAFGDVTPDQTLLHRDHDYEETLRYEASADNNVTPAKVIRWLCSMAGHAITTAPSSAEFQPIVNVYNGQYRAIAAINFKF